MLELYCIYNHGETCATLLKKRLWHRCFPVNFAKFLRTSPVAASNRRVSQTSEIISKGLLIR